MESEYPETGRKCLRTLGSVKTRTNQPFYGRSVGRVVGIREETESRPVHLCSDARLVRSHEHAC